jgi:ABC-type lipoprotein release transport system permease subunit
VLSLRIALRYLFSKKSHRAVNIISSIAIAGVAVATTAIVVVLSVFNGFSRLSEEHMSRIDPDIMIAATAGKSFGAADSLARAISAVADVMAASAVIEEKAMLVSDQARIPVEFKAVGDSYDSVVDLDGVIIDGAYMNSFDTMACMQLSVGVANRTGLRPGVATVAELYVPRRTGRINPANPASSLRSSRMMVTGVLQVDQSDVDNDRIVIPLSEARRMLDYSDEATAIEVSLRPGADAAGVTAEIGRIAGDGFKVLDRHMQQADAFRMIRIEKWVTFMMLVFILLIASFNIISTMSLLIIEKRSDSSILRALGASLGAVRNIFAAQGFLITLTGGTAGIAAGIALSLIQEHLGVIKLAGDPAALTIDVYPVALAWGDIAVVAAAVICVGALTSATTRLFTKNIR